MSAVLGLSHLVIATPDPDAKVAALAERGYRLHGHRDSVPNREAKKPFLCGPMAASTKMRLIVNEQRFPAIEIMCENVESKDGPCFAPGKPAFDLVMGEDPPTQVSVNCVDPERALQLWQDTGFGSIGQDEQGPFVDIRDNAVGPGLRLCFKASGQAQENTWLNHDGLVCVAFHCRDADTMRSDLADKGYEVGVCFDLTPIETPLRLFLMRNCSGEIYEFLSLGKF